MEQRILNAVLDGLIAITAVMLICLLLSGIGQALGLL
jgi:hypothetical protein